MTSPSSIQRILNLQRSAYELLIWLGQRARTDDSILSDENLEKWRVADSSETWVRHNVASFPVALRPVEEDVPSFARLFSSFFSTSFHISETSNERVYHGYYSQEKRRSLVAGAPSTGKRSAKNKAKTREGARELERLALESLALEAQLFPSHAQLNEVLNAPALASEVTIWTYFHELERRSNFSSQGASVHQLWRDLGESERKGLNAERIWEAREALLRALSGS